MRSPRLLTFGVTLVVGVLLAPVAWAAEPVESKSGQQTTTVSLLDHDYAFRLTPGDTGWRLMQEEEIRKFTPDAEAGLAKADGSVWGAVLVERASGSVGDFADLLVENVPLENKRILEKKPIEFLGRKAIRFIVQGTVQSLEVRYATVVVARDDWIYQVTAWALAQGIRDSTPLLQVHDMFFFLDRPVRGRASTSAISDAHGPGWRLTAGRFESAAYRLAVRPGEGWRLIVGDELHGINPAAEIGLYNRTAETYLAVIPEVAWVDDEKGFVDFVRDSLAENLAAEPTGTVKFEVDGKKRTFDVYRADVGIEMEFLHSTWFDDHICYQVLVWYGVGSRELAQGVIPLGVGSLDFLTADETKTLVETLAELPDSTNTVGPDFVLRAGLFRDFAHAVSWTIPDDGIWDVVVGQEARNRNAEAAVVFEEKSRGLNGLVLVEDVGEMSASAFHEAVVENTMANAGALDRPEPIEVRGRGGNGLTTRISPPSVAGQPPIDYQVATFVRDGVGAQMSVYGVPSNMAAGKTLVDSAIGGFDWLPIELAPTVIENGVLRDWRLGFGVETPEGFEGPDDITPAQIAPIGSIVTVSSKDASLAVIGLCPDVDRLDEAFFLEFVEPMLGEELGTRDIELVDSSDGQLDGQKAAHRVFASSKLRAHVFIAIRARTIYGAVIVAENDERIEQLRKSFFFLD